MECPKCKTQNPDDSKFCKECATPLTGIEGIAISQTRTLQTPSERLTRGTLFADRYEIIEELGRGGMGRVYKVRDTQINEEIALKVLKPEIASDENIIERFRNELKIARKITHKNVCRTHDINEVDGTPHITMELVKGESLKSYISKKGHLSEKEAIAIATQVCEGLSEAHELGIVHRDLKPQNIMIDEKGQIKIMDFGIARSTEIQGMTQSGVMIGTPEYISPEQAEGVEVDNRTDIYSLGVVLYEMFTGSTPFKGETALSVALKHKTKLPQDPRKLNPDVSNDLARLILICMEKEKDRRYQTAEELLSDFRNIEEGFPLGTKIRPRSKTAFSNLIRKKYFVPTLILALVIMAVGIWLLLPKGDAGPPSLSDKPTLAIVYFSNFSGDSGVDKWKDIFPISLMDDLGQSKLINVLDITRIYSILLELKLLDSDIYSEADLKNICEIGSVSHILTGRFIRSENNIRTIVTLHRADTLEILGTAEVEGNIEDDRTLMVDQLTPKIKNLFGLSEALVADDIDFDIGEIRPHSREAYEAYSQGYKAHFTGGDYDKAIEFYEKTLELEPDFGYVMILISQCYFNKGNPDESIKYAERAAKFPGRMSAREWNYARAYLNMHSEGTIDTFFEALQGILADYPDEYDANVDSGYYHFFLEEYEKTIRFNGTLYQKVKYPTLYKYLSLAYSAIGSYEEADDCLDFYLENIDENWNLRKQKALVHLCQNDFNKALLTIEKSPKTDPNLDHLYAIGRIKYCQEDFIGAEKAFEDLKQSQISWMQYDAYKNLPNIFIAQGRFEEARSHVEEGISFTERENMEGYGPELYLALLYILIKAEQEEEAIKAFDESWENVQKAGFFSEMLKRRLMYLKGIAALQMGDLEGAQEIAASLKELIDSGRNKKAIRIYYHLAGLIEERNGNLAKALQYSSDALEMTPFESDLEVYLKLDKAPYLESIGRIYTKLDEPDKAIEQFEKIQGLTLGRLDYGDIYAKSYYNLGKIYEQKGWPGRAIESYDKFLDLWKNADPGLPEVEDAKKRLVGLRQ